MGMRQNSMVVPSAAAIREKIYKPTWIKVKNPSANANSIYVRTDGTAATASATASDEVAPGQTRDWLFDPEDGDATWSIIAASSDTTVIVTRQTFRSRLILEVVGWAAAIAVTILSELWIAAAGVVQLAPGYSEAQVDTLRARTASTRLTIAKDGSGTYGITIGTTGNPQGNANVLMGYDSNAYMEWGSGSLQALFSTTLRWQSTASGFSLENATPLVVRSGNGSDPRFTMNSTDFIAHTPVAGGNIRSSCHCIELPIKNGSTVAAGDLVEFAANTNNNSVQSAAAASANMQIGVCVSGGTGNAGLTVFARIVIMGYVPSVFLADTGGVTYGQYAKVGGNNANRVISTAAASLANFGMIVLTATAGNPTSIFFKGPGA